MSSNDKTADLLVATTRATKADTGTEPSATGKAGIAPAEAKASKKKAASKKVAKKVASKKTTARKAPAKKVSSKAKAALKKKEVEAIVSFGRRVWPD